MRGLERRLQVLEGGRTGDPFAGLSDEQLEAELDATLCELDRMGELPAGYREWPDGRCLTWLRDAIGETV